MVEAMPRWLQFTTIFALLATVLVWNVRELRWLRRQRREMATEHARFVAMTRGEDDPRP